MENLKTSEQVSKYHPDKIADQISDFVLEKISSGVGAVETIVKGNTVFIAGEIENPEQYAHTTIEYFIKEYCKKLSYYPTEVIVRLTKQSVEISKAVFKEKTGAGDQGFVYGYAKRGNEQYLPHDIYIANRIIEEIEKLVPDTYIKGDAKTQVFVNGNNSVKHVVVSVAHSKYVDIEKVREELKKYLIKQIPEIKDSIIEINPAGTWNKSGPYADTGVTGRKIVADQYGGRIPVGGGAFSGKDLTKVDRSGAYALRLIAVEMVKKYKIIDEILIEVGYIIGQSKPYSVYATTGGVYSEIVTENIKREYDLSVDGVIRKVHEYLKEHNLTLKDLASGNHMKRLI